MNRIIIEGEERDFLDWREGSGETIEIFDIVVNSERGKGKGRRLVRELIDQQIPQDTRMVFAITRADNFIAQQFYEALRFRTIAALRWFYKDPQSKRSVDAVMYGFDVGNPI